MDIIEMNQLKTLLDENYTICFQDGWINGNIVGIDLEDSMASIMDFTSEEEFSIDLENYKINHFNWYV